ASSTTACTAASACRRARRTCSGARRWTLRAGASCIMRAGHEEDGPLTAAQVNAWDNCLGCMACVTACPSGVQYDKLIEDTRAQVERRFARPRLERRSE